MSSPSPKPNKLPNPRIAELALLQAVHDSFDRIADVQAEVRASWFHDPRLRQVYEAMIELATAGERPSLESLRRVLPVGQGPGEGGSWIELLVQVGEGAGIRNASYLSHRIRTVREQAAVRGVIETAAEALANAPACRPGLDDSGVPELVAGLEEKLLAISESGATGARSMGIAEALAAHLATLEDGGGVRIPLGFFQLDYFLGGGIGPGELFTVAARPGVGKSTVLLQVARNVASSGKRVLFFSLEMMPQALVGRLLANVARVDHSRIRRRVIDADESARIGEAVETMKGLAIDFVSAPNLTVGALVSRIRAAKMQGGVDLVVLDYLQLVTSNGENRTQEVSKVSRGLKLAALDTGVPILTASQLSRAAETSGRPQLWHLRESGTIEQDSDEVLLLWPETDENGDEVDGGLHADLAKNRDGETGEERLRIEKRYAWVGDVSPDGIGVPLEEAFPGSVAAPREESPRKDLF